MATPRALHPVDAAFVAWRTARGYWRAWRRCTCALAEDVISFCACGRWHPSHELGCPAERLCPAPVV